MRKRKLTGKNRKQKHPKRDAELKNQPSKAPIINPKKTRMDFAAEILMWAGCFVLAIAGILVATQHKLAWIWFLFTAITIGALGLCLKLHAKAAAAAKSESTIPAPLEQQITNPAPAEPKPQLPATKAAFPFEENTDTLYITIGGLEASNTREVLQTERTAILDPDGATVKYGIQNNEFYADVTLVGRNGPSVLIDKGKFKLLDRSFDCNWNDRAIEIVDRANSPVFQMFRKSPAAFVVNLRWEGKHAMIYSYEGEVMRRRALNAPPPPELPRLFKYPAWQHRGILASRENGDALE